MRMSRMPPKKKKGRRFRGKLEAKRKEEKKGSAVREAFVSLANGKRGGRKKGESVFFE